MKKLTKLLFLCGAGVLAFPLIGCEIPKFKTPSIVLKCASEVSELERHETLQFSVELKNVEESAVTYKVSSEVATIDAAGKLTVKDDAAIGTQFTVSAVAGETKSNEFNFKVKDTIATQINLTPSATAFFDSSEVITFQVECLPEYASINTYNLSVVRGEDVVDLEEGKLTFKKSLDFVEHFGEAVRVRAALKADPNVKDEVQINIGAESGKILVGGANIVARKNGSFNVTPHAYDSTGKEMTELLVTDFTYKSSDESVFTVSQSGVITAVGHGTSKLSVEYEDLKGESTINVIVSPQSIQIEGVTPTILNRDMKFAKGEEFTLKVSETKESKYSNVSKEYKYDLKLFNGTDLLSDEDADIATIVGNKFTFKQTGKVQLDIMSDSTLGGEVVNPEYEAKTTLMFDINEGKNASNYAELQEALGNPSILNVNLVNDFNITNEEVNKSDQGIWTGIDAHGSKNLNGNGYQISLKALDMNGEDLITDSNTTGGTFLFFLADNRSGKGHDPFTVNISDFALIGNTDFNGLYNGDGNPGSGIAFNSKGKFSGSFRTGIALGYTNSRENFVDDDGTLINDENSGAYIETPSFTNVTVDGFNFGIWLRHVVEGTFTNCNTVNAAEKGFLTEQCILDLVNPTFGQNGAFCIELTQDGVNNMKNYPAPGDSTDIYYTRVPTAGRDYNEPSEINMSGTINVNNFNAGADTTYMQGFAAELKATMGYGSIAEVINAVNLGVSQIIGANILDQHPKKADAIQAAIDVATSIIYNNEQKINFFALSFMIDLSLPSMGLVDNFAVVKENGEKAITMIEIMQNEALAVLQGGHDVSYKTHKYIDFELMDGDGHDLGKAVIINNAYQGA